MSAAWASATSGTWAGCTTRWNTCGKTRSSASTTTTSRRSARSMLFRRTSSCPCRTTKSCYGKGSLLTKMPGDDWQKFANLRLLLGLHVCPARQEVAFHGRANLAEERMEPRCGARLGPCSSEPHHAGCGTGSTTSTAPIAREPALHKYDCDPRGLPMGRMPRLPTRARSTFLRKGGEGDADILVACNFTPIPRTNYRVGAPRGGLLGRDSQ